MTKHLRLCVLLVAMVLIHVAGSAAQIAFDETNFPDQIFREFIQKYFSSAISNGNINTDRITSLNLSLGDGNKITDLTGIKNFTNLQTLTLPVKPSFAIVDVSGLTKLTSISNGVTCTVNSKIPDASEINIAKYQGALTTVNASGCTSLQTVKLAYYKTLTALDLNGITTLTTLQVSYTGISSLDVAGNTIGDINDGGEIYIINCPNLLSCKIGYQPYVSNFQLKYTSVRHLDLSGLTGEHGQIRQSIAVGDNKLKDIIMPDNDKMYAFTFAGNQFTYMEPLNGGGDYHGHNYDNLTTYSDNNPQTCYVGTAKRVKLFPAWATQYPNAKPSDVTGGSIELGDDGWYYFNFTNTTQGSYTFNFGVNSTYGKMKVILRRQDDPDPDPEERQIEDFYMLRVPGSPSHLVNMDSNATESAKFVYTSTDENGDHYALPSNLTLNGYYRICNAETIEDATLNFGASAVDTHLDGTTHPLLVKGKVYSLELDSELHLSTHFDVTNNQLARLVNPRGEFIYAGETPEARAVANSTFELSDASTTGVESVITGDEGVEAEYYTLQGVKVGADALTPGFYICRRGAKVTKVIIR